MAVQLPGEVIVTIPEEGTMCECQEHPVLADRFTIQHTQGDGVSAPRTMIQVHEPMFMCKVCWARELSGTDNNHLYGVIPIRLTF